MTLPLPCTQGLEDIQQSCCRVLQGSSLAQLAYTPDTNVLDAYWQRTAAILARRPEGGDDASVELGDDEDGRQDRAGSLPAAQAAAAARRDAIAGSGRLVALQVRIHAMHAVRIPSRGCKALCTFKKAERL